MKKITAKIDLGTRQTFEKWNGKFLDESAYTEVITVTEDTAILKPVATLEGEIPLAYIITDAYPNNRVRDVLMSIEDSSTMRANCSGPIDKKDMESINYKYNEDKALAELSKYIDSTYDEHYSKNKFQATEFIIDGGHGEGFCIGNILKYAQRYGKKGGKNRDDLLKVIHYGIIALYVNDHEVGLDDLEIEMEN